MKALNELRPTPSYSARWQQDFQESIRATDQLEMFLELETPLAKVPYPVFIPKPFALKIKEAGLESPLALQFIPSFHELDPSGFSDPIGDQVHAKGNGVIHRYQNRILYTPTEVCPVQCRYCFRKNELQQSDLDIFKSQLSRVTEYLASNPQVEEVILTGGDPLILSDDKFETILEAFSGIPSVTMVRFHSRTPVILPNRITPRFLEIIRTFSKRFQILTLVIHTNHLSEFTPEFLASLELLRKTNLQLLSQSVLLKGVNDSWEDLKVLFMGLYRNGVKPYYLHHPDPVKGGMHFMLSREEGARIYRDLKSNVSGVLLPHYVIDSVDGSGKKFALEF